MIFRLSQKLNKKIDAGPLPPMPLDENPYADWSCHLFTADRTQYILLANTKSLYSCVMYGKGITNDGVLIDRAFVEIRESMEYDGLAFLYQTFLAPALRPLSFAKALNRSVTGSLNELVQEAKMWLAEGELSPADVGSMLNEMPLSALEYADPREAFKMLAGECQVGEG